MTPEETLRLQLAEEEVLRLLYEHASRHEGMVLDDLTVMAGLVWLCDAPCLWRNPRSCFACQECGKPDPARNHRTEHRYLTHRELQLIGRYLFDEELTPYLTSNEHPPGNGLCLDVLLTPLEAQWVDQAYEEVIGNE